MVESPMMQKPPLRSQRAVPDLFLCWTTFQRIPTAQEATDATRMDDMTSMGALASPGLHMATSSEASTCQIGGWRLEVINSPKMGIDDMANYGRHI